MKPANQFLLPLLSCKLDAHGNEEYREKMEYYSHISATRSEMASHLTRKLNSRCYFAYSEIN